MKRKRISVEQIIAVLRQAELGALVGEIVRKPRDFRADILPLEEEIRWP